MRKGNHFTGATTKNRRDRNRSTIIGSVSPTEDPAANSYSEPSSETGFSDAAVTIEVEGREDFISSKRRALIEELPTALRAYGIDTYLRFARPPTAQRRQRQPKHPPEYMRTVNLPTLETIALFIGEGITAPAVDTLVDTLMRDAIEWAKTRIRRDPDGWRNPGEQHVRVTIYDPTGEKVGYAQISEDRVTGHLTSPTGVRHLDHPPRHSDEPR